MRGSEEDGSGDNFKLIYLPWHTIIRHKLQVQHNRFSASFLSHSAILYVSETVLTSAQLHSPRLQHGSSAVLRSIPIEQGRTAFHRYNLMIVTPVINNPPFKWHRFRFSEHESSICPVSHNYHPQQWQCHT